MQHTPQGQLRWQVPFFTIWTGQAMSLLGSMLVQFALVWWLTEKTGSATVLAIGTLVSLLPGIVLGPLFGALVDRWNRRVVMLVADTIIALATLVLAYLFAVDGVRIWHIYAIMFIRALGSGVHWPAMQASTSLMVPEEHLSRVAGLNQALQGISNILSPPLGAFLMQLMPLQAILAIDVGTAMLAIVPLFFVHIPQPQRTVTEDTQAHSKKPSVWRDLREGLKYVLEWPGLLIIIIMGALGNLLFNPAFSLMPLLVTDHFGGRAVELGWMEASLGIGIVLGGLILSAWGGFRRRILTTIAGFTGLGLGVLILGLIPASAYSLALGAMFIVGVAISMTDGPLMAVIQASVAPEMQGRVFTLLISAVKIASPLSLVIAGPIADLVGVRIWYVVAGVACLLMGVAGFFVPAVVYLEENNRNGRTRVGDTPPMSTVPVYAEVE
jgi:DHA3 family macrolide efflux protein-like MFS transporter